MSAPRPDRTPPVLETQRAFSALSEEYVEVSLRHDPVAATRAGVHDYDSLLPDHSPDGMRARSTWLRDFDQRLVASVPWEELSIGPRVEFAFLRASLAAERARVEELHRAASNPARPPATALEGVFLLAARPFAPLEDRKEALLERLMAIPEYLEGARLHLQRASAPALAAARDLNLSGPAYLDGVMRALLRAFPGEAERIEHAGERARVGFLRYQEFLDLELRPRGEAPFAVGERWLNYLIEHEHLLSMDAAFVDAHARETMARGERELEAEARRLEPSRPWREQIDAARRRHPEALRLREAYESEVERARAFTAEQVHPSMPGCGLELLDTPEYQQAARPFAGYDPPAPLETERVGFLFVTPIDLGQSPEAQAGQLAGHDYATLSLRVARESWPGRHLQACAAMQGATRLRRLAMSPLACDGWALEAGGLMLEAGFCLDPRARLFRLRDQLEAAALAAVDVGLHLGRLTLEEAETLLVERARMPRAAALAAVRGAALEPARTLCAMVGSALIAELREEWRSKLGDAFDAAAFHAALLSVGRLPIFLVREELNQRLTA